MGALELPLVVRSPSADSTVERMPGDGGAAMVVTPCAHAGAVRNVAASPGWVNAAVANGRWDGSAGTETECAVASAPS
ncbi:hypothetical protein MINS_11110 [Mycolicibacterium insubricum]|nr:hypothetical protein MINS_11110 [Mycolicibacterium insubricum]